jgi:hypothetical protein
VLNEEEEEWHYGHASADSSAQMSLLTCLNANSLSKAWLKLPIPFQHPQFANLCQTTHRISAADMAFLHLL